MPGLAVLGRLEVDVDVAVARGEDPAMAGRMKTNDDRLDLRQFEGDLNLLVLVHVVRRIADPVQHMKLDQIVARPCTRKGRGRAASSPAAAAACGTNRSSAAKDDTAGGIGTSCQRGT